MADFNLDLRAVEDHLEGDDEEGSGRVTLAVLDGTTPDEEWIDAVEGGDVLVLAIEGDLNVLAAGFAREIKEMGGDLVHFRGFLVVTPPDTSVNTDRLSPK